MRRKLKRVYKCQVGRCYAAPSLDDCYGVHICDKCKLCTSDNRIVKTVKRDDIIYEVVHVSADEIILFSREYKKLISVSPNLDEFIKNFNVVELGSYYEDEVS
jgi:hypothetical protein